jgi:hypothetical protein
MTAYTIDNVQDYLARGRFNRVRQLRQLRQLAQRIEEDMQRHAAQAEGERQIVDAIHNSILQTVERGDNLSAWEQEHLRRALEIAEQLRTGSSGSGNSRNNRGTGGSRKRRTRRRKRRAK